MEKSGFATHQLVAIAFTLFSLGLSAYFYLYGNLPDAIATHWDELGRVNGYMPKAIGLFILPIISAFIIGLMLIIPKIDPLKSNIKEFQSYFWNFTLVLSGFFFYINALSIYANLGNVFNLFQYMLPAFFVLLYYIGIMMENAKQNWFIGIRTPWTLSSPAVWNKTHALGGKVYRACACLSLLGLVFPTIAVWLLIGPLLSGSLGLVVYSYAEFQKREERR